MRKKVTLFVASHCIPCRDVIDTMKSGKFLIDGEEGDVNVIDVEDESGYPNIDKHNISKLPSAITEDGKSCNILEHEGTVFIECEEDGENQT